MLLKVSAIYNYLIQKANTFLRFESILSLPQYFLRSKILSFSFPKPKLISCSSLQIWYFSGSFLRVVTSVLQLYISTFIIPFLHCFVVQNKFHYRPLYRSICTFDKRCYLLLCRGEDSNLQGFPHMVLNHARLPISPPRLTAVLSHAQ